MGYRGYSELRRGLLLHLPLSEGIGTSVKDTSHFRNNGVFGVGAAAPSWVEGREGGRAVEFDGGDHIDLGAGTFVDADFADKGSTLSTWVKISGAPVYGTIQAMISLADRIYIIILTTGIAQFVQFDGAFKVVNSNAIIPGGVWNNIVGFWDATTMGIAVNGITQSDTTACGNPTIHGGRIISIGNNWAFNTPLTGQLGDTRVYNRALDAVERRNLNNLKGLI